MSDYKKREDILLKLVNTLILPKNPEIINVTVKSMFYRERRKYVVILFFNSVEFFEEYYSDLHNEIVQLFNMASLDVRNHSGSRDFVLVDVDFI